MLHVRFSGISIALNVPRRPKARVQIAWPERSFMLHPGHKPVGLEYPVLEKPDIPGDPMHVVFVLKFAVHGVYLRRVPLTLTGHSLVAK